MQTVELVAPKAAELGPISRKLGDTEASYYLPSRADGVNDMYLHLGFEAPFDKATRARLRSIWAILRVRHPLLASTVQMNSYEDIQFQYAPPAKAEDALKSADSALEFRSDSGEAIIDSYLNGPRTLSNERLAYLVVSSDKNDIPETSAEGTGNFDILLCTTHYLGDGMALHQTAHDFFKLLGGDLDEKALADLLEQEVSTVVEGLKKGDARYQLPLPLEERLPSVRTERFSRAATTVDYLLDQRRQIGGHAFPRRPGQPRKTIVPTVSYDAEKTKRILKKCKEQGVSISSVIFALCNYAWAKTYTQNWEQPQLMYSALNLRSYLKANEALNNSYWFIAIGYFNIILPTFFPSNDDDATRIFWHRARSVKVQTAKVAKHPQLIARSKEMAVERGIRARVWAAQDDGVEATVTPPKRTILPPSDAPSKALIGLSMLGNLDGIYKHQTFEAVKLHTLTTGSRQRQGAMLLFGYTFVGKLWLSLGYDVNGFDDEVVKKFWDSVLKGVDGLLL